MDSNYDQRKSTASTITIVGKEKQHKGILSIKSALVKKEHPTALHTFNIFL